MAALTAVSAGFLSAPPWHLPILLSGHGDEALRRTAELADGGNGAWSSLSGALTFTNPCWLFGERAVEGTGDAERAEKDVRDGPETEQAPAKAGAGS